MEIIYKPKGVEIDKELLRIFYQTQPGAMMLFDGKKTEHIDVESKSLEKDEYIIWCSTDIQEPLRLGEKRWMCVDTIRNIKYYGDNGCIYLQVLINLVSSDGGNKLLNFFTKRNKMVFYDKEFIIDTKEWFNYNGWYCTEEIKKKVSHSLGTTTVAKNIIRDGVIAWGGAEFQYLTTNGKQFIAHGSPCASDIFRLSTIVRWVQEGSIMYNLGLKVGDVIHKITNTCSTLYAPDPIKLVAWLRTNTLQFAKIFIFRFNDAIECSEALTLTYKVSAKLTDSQRNFVVAHLINNSIVPLDRKEKADAKEQYLQLLDEDLLSQGGAEKCGWESILN